MAFLATLLSAARAGSVRGLRMMEVATFGLAAAVVAVHLWHAQLSAAARGEPTALAAGSKDAVIGTTIVMFTYALLVPAPTGRALAGDRRHRGLSGRDGGVPVPAHPEVFRLARRAATGQRIGETLFLLTASALLAGYGAYLIRTMSVRRGGPAIQPVSPPGRDRGRRDGSGLPRRAPAAEGPAPSR